MFDLIIQRRLLPKDVHGLSNFQLTNFDILISVCYERLMRSF